MHHKTVTILLRIRVREHFVMSITKHHESHYVGVLDNPHVCLRASSFYDGCMCSLKVFLLSIIDMNLCVSLIYHGCMT